jgi:flavorubredoxin
MIDTHEIAPGIHRIALHDEADMGDMSPPGTTTNLFLLAATQPAIVQTLPRRTFQRVRDAVAKIVEPASLRYIVVPHHEADSSGALNEWLAEAPDATVLCSEMCAFLNLNDFSNKKPVTVVDGETVDLGSHRLRFVVTPMVNQWDSMMVYEETSGMLFPNDLFSGLGTDVTADMDLSDQYVEGARMVGYQADDRTALGRALDKIDQLDLEGIAPMHGPVLTAHFDEYVDAFRKNSVAAAVERSVLLGPASTA